MTGRPFAGRDAATRLSSKGDIIGFSRKEIAANLKTIIFQALRYLASVAGFGSRFEIKLSLTNDLPVMLRYGHLEAILAFPVKIPEISKPLLSNIDSRCCRHVVVC